MTKNHKIYIIHGILGGKYEYGLLIKALKKEGFISEVFSYKSRKEHILDVGKKLYEKIKEEKNDDNSLAKKLPTKFPEETDVGIIAGIRGNKYGYNPFIGSDNDGEIKLEETKLGTEKDFATVKRSHITILQSRKTTKLTLQFLKAENFSIE